MKLAIPLTADGLLSDHFGSADQVGIYEMDTDNRTIVGEILTVPPVDEHCEWAGWLRSQGVSLLITGGLGVNAQASMDAAGIETIAGALTEEPRVLVNAWMNGTLATGENPCEGHVHADDEHHHHHHHGRA